MSTNQLYAFIAIFLTAITASHSSYSQIRSDCDSVYQEPQKPASYKENDRRKINDANGRIAYIVGTCTDSTEAPVSSLKMMIDINAEGDVMRINFPYLQCDECKQKIAKEVRSWTGWTPAMHNENWVCSTHVWNIMCFLWE